MRAAAIVVVFLMVASPGVAQVTRQAAERTERQDAFPQSLQELVAHTSPSHLCNRPGHLLGICRAHSSRGGAPTSEALGESWRSWRARALKKHLSPCERLILSTQRSQEQAITPTRGPIRTRGREESCPGTFQKESFWCGVRQNGSFRSKTR